MSDMPNGTGSPEYDNSKPLLIQEYERLKAENERLREALREYADQDNWVFVDNDYLCETYAWDDSFSKPFNIAHKALRQAEENK